ncbi:MAG: hypothetical protein JWO03_3768 [Bacteroidetes bacterium]|nr:hypothetical protein [Bacteroidota bacterium]
MDTASAAMQQAQEAANSEDKSSAGDKYETSRAMNQIERDNAAYQLSVAIQDMNLLQTIDADHLYTQADNGAVIQSSDALYFIATGLGVITFVDIKVVVLSPKAPLSTALRGKVKGDSLTLNGKTIGITDVF